PEILVEEDATAAILGDEALAHAVDPAERRVPVTLELANDGARVQVIPSGQAQAFCEHAEVNAVVRIPIDDSVHRAVDVQKHPVVAAPVRKRGVRSEAGSKKIMHDNGHLQFFRKL